jgi:polysaccharide export outer membrane protein
VPTIYRLNLRDPSGFFLADGFSIRANDIVYVANAPSVDFLKFMTVVRSVTSVARDVSGVARDVDLTIGANQGRGESTQFITDPAPAPIP